MLSIHSSIGDLKALSRLLKTPRRVLWRRWRLPLLLALPSAVLLSWLGLSIRPHLGPVTTGWRAAVVTIAIVAILLMSLAMVSRRSRRIQWWSHGAYPASERGEVGWFVAEVHSVTMWLVAVLTTAALGVWVQANNDHVNPVATFGAWVMLARLLRDRVDPHHRAIGITASGVYHGTQLYRWEQIEKLWADDDDHFGFFVAQRPLDLGTPLNGLKSTDILNVINYYLRRPYERALIASANVR